MDNVKGNAAVNVGYSCKQRELVKGWRAIWSETKGTTEPDAPFGLVTLASSGTEGGPNMGTSRDIYIWIPPCREFLKQIPAVHPALNPSTRRYAPRADRWPRCAPER